MVFFAGASIAAAQSRRQNKDVKIIAAKFAAAYEAKDLGRLDALRLIRGTVKVDIGFAYADERDAQPDVVRRFRSFKTLERWLDRRAEKGVDNPSRNPRTLKECRKNRCSFEDERGSLHNQLYLSEIVFRHRNGRLFIKEISLWNGD